MIPREVLRKTMPGTAAILDHPRIKEDEQLTFAIETFADRDAVEKLSLDQISYLFGTMMGGLHAIIRENDLLRERVSKAVTAVSSLLRPQ